MPRNWRESCGQALANRGSCAASRLSAVPVWLDPKQRGQWSSQADRGQRSGTYLGEVVHVELDFHYSAREGASEGEGSGSGGAGRHSYGATPGPQRRRRSVASPARSFHSRVGRSAAIKLIARSSGALRQAYRCARLVRRRVAGLVASLLNLGADAEHSCLQAVPLPPLCAASSILAAVLSAPPFVCFHLIADWASYALIVPTVPRLCGLTIATVFGLRRATAWSEHFMSSSVDVHRRPDIWSYFSFSSAPRRRTSLSLPLKSNSTFDPFEKADRHSTRPSRSSTAASSFMNEYKVGGGSGSSTMNQGQRTRYLKAGGIIAFILIIFFYLAPGHSQTAGGTSSPKIPIRNALSLTPI